MKSKLFFLIPLLTAGCAGYSITGGPGKTVAPSLQTRVSDPKALVAVNSVVLAPISFDPDILDGKGEIETELNRQLQEIVTGEVNLEVVLPKEKRLQPVPPQMGAEPDLPTLLRSARASGADALWITRINTYRQRAGSAVGANEPARVAFTMDVYTTAEGRPVWHGSYYYEDQALSDNLFRIGKTLDKTHRQSGWLSADRLVRDGFREAARDFAAKRVTAFSGPGR